MKQKIYLLFLPLAIWLFLGQLFQFYYDFLELMPQQETGPKRRVAFLKTHKCASTTIQNILLRYAYKNNLTLVLPDHGNYIFNGADGFTLEGTQWYQSDTKPDIFCLHSIWNDMNQVKNVLGAQVYFTILRDPIDAFESLWTYENCSKHFQSVFGKMPSIDEFIEMSDKLDPRLVNFPRFSLKHVLFQDFGLPVFANQSMIKAKIQEIEDNFDLVMIMEDFETSIVLLKQILDWDYEDLASLKLNARMEHYKQLISNETRSKMKVWLKDDYQLYNHFKAKLESLKGQFGYWTLRKELKKYHIVQEIARAKCPMEIVSKFSLPVEDRPYGHGTQAYRMVNKTKNGPTIDQECQLLGIQELKFISFLRVWQNNRINRLA